MFRTSKILPFLVLAFVLIPSAAHADAILPSLILIWPITILLLIPIIGIEVLYSKPQLGMTGWESIRVVGAANVLSSIAGLPLANLFSAGVQYALESLYFRDPSLLQERAAQMLTGDVRRHDYMRLVLLGLYPRWILLLSAVTMVSLCFLVSWWVEAKWVQRHLTRTSSAVDNPRVWKTVRNANLLSYGIVLVVVMWLFLKLWPQGLAQAIGQHSH
jgi:hypothetical protein